MELKWHVPSTATPRAGKAQCTISGRGRLELVCQKHSYDQTTDQEPSLWHPAMWCSSDIIAGGGTAEPDPEHSARPSSAAEATATATLTEGGGGSSSLPHIEPDCPRWLRGGGQALQEGCSTVHVVVMERYHFNCKPENFLWPTQTVGSEQAGGEQGGSPADEPPGVGTGVGVGVGALLAGRGGHMLEAVALRLHAGDLEASERYITHTTHEATRTRTRTSRGALQEEEEEEEEEEVPTR